MVIRLKEIINYFYDHQMNVVCNLVTRTLVDEAEGEVWPNPICIT